MTLIGKVFLAKKAELAVVVAEDKATKLKMLKLRRVNRSKTRRGHRQHHALVRVKEIRTPPAQGEDSQGS